MKKVILIIALIVSMVASATQNDGWCLQANQREGYTGICLANGNIGLVTNEHLFGVNEILINGVYDRGNELSAVSSPVYSPNFLNLFLAIDGNKVKDEDATNWKQTLNMKEATLVTEFDLPQAHVKYSLLVFRNLQAMAVTDVEITPYRDIDLQAVNQTTLSYTSLNPEYSYENIVGININNIRTFTNYYKTDVSCSSCFVVNDKGVHKDICKCIYNGTQAMCLKAHLEKGKAFRFALVGAVCTSRDFTNPSNEASRMILFVVCKGLDKVLEEHKKEWQRLWQSDIQIEGDMQSQIDVRSALYHLYSFVGEDNRLSPSPMGLSSGGYNRHVFWDTEIWMYPPLLMLNQRMAKSCVDYRIDRMKSAQKRAKMFGYRGVMFPWESDDFGEEACPLYALTGTLEHHITADVAIACWNYYCVTGDKQWLKQYGFPLISEVAEFVCSRVTKNADGTYSLCNVVGADEYSGNVDDNAYTNATAQVALRYAIKAAKTIGEKPCRQWFDVEKGMKYHYFEDGVVKEYATYNGQGIKQADVILMVYPLQLISDKELIRKNLEYYAKVMDPNGPAMGNSIQSILYACLGDSDNAFRLWKQSYEPHKCKPFGVLAEGPGGNNPYFSTGAGGMLQAVLCGFAGLRITDKGIVSREPCLPKTWKKLTITGVGPQKKTIVVNQR